MANYNQVSYGAKGSDVTELQKLLNNNGYNLDVDGNFGSKTQAAVKDYQQKNGLAVDGIVGTNTWGTLTKASTASGGSSSSAAAPAEPKYPEYTMGDTAVQADAKYQQLAGQKPGEYKPTWEGQLKDTIAQILNREQFSYDLNGDALYQQMKDQYINQGQMAMMDTMGQAAAMTGGYGNSYAQSVGQQAYQQHLKGLNDKVPELYQMALNKYNQEGQALYDQASLMAGMEDQEYSRYMDQLTNYYTELGLAQDEARYQAELDYGRYMDKLGLDYQMERDKIGDEQWQKQFDESVRQYNEQMALSKSKDSGGGGGNPGKDYTAPSGWDDKKIREFQKANGLTVDGKWGPQTAAAYEKFSNISETEGTKNFEKQLIPESKFGEGAKSRFGSYSNYFDLRIQEWLKAGLTEDEAVYLYSKYGIYD